MLSIVVNFYNNRREAANTLYALTRKYQGLAADFRYEVIALDHGSTLPLSAEDVRAFGPEFVYRYIETSDISPVRAVNAACRDAAGDRLAIMIDGAHIVSPGVLAGIERAFTLFASPFVATVPLHLGPKVQNASVKEGYDQRAEDELLRRLAWKDDGYRLFAGAGSFSDGSLGWFGCLFESGCFALAKRDFVALGGFDERFQSRGGGLVNLDFFQRAAGRRDLEYVLLLGEGTFHQFHGGVASNAPADATPWKEFHEEYQRLTGRRFERVARRPYFLGAVPPHALAATRISADLGLEQWLKWRAGGVRA
ncbi:MAG TPA: hypothetical protein VFB32_02160 [Rudaea sp.]|nr:hypothetical protein [Rudaea sp.]